MPAGVIDASQLTKLASELEVLLRAGSPLGPGLLEAAPRWRGPLGPAAEKLALRLQSGVPVDEALRTASELPPVFRALAATGLSTNRAADVLEAYSRTTAQMLTLREKLLRGLMYPAIVVLMAYGLSILVVLILLPQMAELVRSMTQSSPWWAGIVDRLRETLPVWSWAVPLAVILIWGLGLLLLPADRSGVGWWGTIPLVRRTLNDIHCATASQLLAALIECEVPLPLALSLVFESLASKRNQAAISTIADRVQNGEPAATAFREGTGAPPLWRELFARETESDRIRGGLLNVADVLGERARNRADLIGRTIPLVLIAVIGGGTVIAYATIVFGPLMQIWDRLGGAQ